MKRNFIFYIQDGLLDYAETLNEHVFRDMYNALMISVNVSVLFAVQLPTNTMFKITKVWHDMTNEEKHTIDQFVTLELHY